MNLVWTLLLVLSPAAHADDALRAKIVGLLSGYEEAPEAAAIVALGDGVAAELLALASTPGTSGHVRERATRLLGAFPTEAHRAFLATTLADVTASQGLRRSAAYALVDGWKDAALADLEPGLTATDIQVRAHTARALGTLKAPAATARLTSLEATETNPMVKSVVTSLLTADAR